MGLRLVTDERASGGNGGTDRAARDGRGEGVRRYRRLASALAIRNIKQRSLSVRRLQLAASTTGNALSLTFSAGILRVTWEFLRRPQLSPDAYQLVDVDVVTCIYDRFPDKS